jgi:hypothetical protein
MFNVIGKYPVASIAAISGIIFTLGPVLFSLFLAAVIVLPMYLAVQVFGNKD